LNSNGRGVGLGVRAYTTGRRRRNKSRRRSRKRAFPATRYNPSARQGHATHDSRPHTNATRSATDPQSSRAVMHVTRENAERGETWTNHQTRDHRARRCAFVVVRLRRVEGGGGKGGVGGCDGGGSVSLRPRCGRAAAWCTCMHGPARATTRAAAARAAAARANARARAARAAARATLATHVESLSPQPAHACMGTVSGARPVGAAWQRDLRSR
jgi:hypothetical protein